MNCEVLNFFHSPNAAVVSTYSARVKKNKFLHGPYLNIDSGEGQKLAAVTGSMIPAAAITEIVSSGNLSSKLLSSVSIEHIMSHKILYCLHQLEHLSPCRYEVHSANQHYCFLMFSTLCNVLLACAMSDNGKSKTGELHNA